MSNVIDFPTLNGNTLFEDMPITTLNREAIDGTGMDNRMVWDLNTTVAMSVADGEYALRYEALNADAEDSADWFSYIIESHLPIRVVDGKFDVASVLHTAQHLMDIAGYWGVYVEDLEYNVEGEYFELIVGS